MTTLLVTHPSFTDHDTGFGHPERPDRMRAIDKVLAHESYAALKRMEAPLRDDVERHILLAHPRHHFERMRRVGDYRLDQLLFEGPAYQDWAATHVALEKEQARVRIYVVEPGASNEARAAIVAAAR